MVEAKTDTRSIPELFAAATDWSRDEGRGEWAAVFTLQRIGSREVLERAVHLLQSADPRSRARAAYILGQLGVPERSYPDECLAAVITLLAQDTDSRVLRAAVIAVGYLVTLRAIPEAIGVAGHPDADVRQAVAFALGGRTDPASVATLIHLTSDESAYVRDWATFGIGQRNSLDTPEIRDALYRRIDDVDEDTRFEAVYGLARCGDLRAVRPLIKEIIKDGKNYSLWPPAAALLKIDLDNEEEVTAEDLVSRLLALKA